MTSAAATVEKPRLYAELEDRLLARDQVGGSRVYCELLRQGRPLPEIMAEAVRIHAPYTHVPYHQRIDDGFPNFVNNDHCLLSARAAINLEPMLPEKLAALLSPGLSALGQSVFLLIGYGAALREFCRQGTGGDVGRRGGFRLPFVAAQPDCTGGEDKNDEGHDREGRNSIEGFRVHQ